MANRKRDALADLEVTVGFEPARISKQMLERAFELLLPVQRRQLLPVTRQLSQSEMKSEQVANKKEVA